MIDADIHHAVPKVEALFPYLDQMWVEYMTQSAFRGPVDTAYPPSAPTSALEGSKPEGGPPGSALDLLRAQALGPDVEIGILNCLYAVDSIHNPDTAAALAHAVNDWTAAEWLAKEPRLRASIVVPSQNPSMAAREVDRVMATHRGFVQVLLPARTRTPLGGPASAPILEAATRHGLPIGIHFGGAPGNPPTPVGWPATYLEEYAVMAPVMQAQLVGLVGGGTFERFPTLKVALLEGGWSWLPWLACKLGDSLPRDRVRVSTAPGHLPSDGTALAALLRSADVGSMLLYGSDYPHRHDEDPRAVLARLPGAVAAENARELYRL